MIFVIDIVFEREYLEEFNNTLDESIELTGRARWLTLRRNKLRISRNKTEYIKYDFRGKNQEVNSTRRKVTNI